MTYENYIEETTNNCMSVLADCSSGQLLDVEYIRKILWEDDRVTGVYSGYCTSANGAAAENIKGVLLSDIFHNAEYRVKSWRIDRTSLERY